MFTFRAMYSFEANQKENNDNEHKVERDQINERLRKSQDKVLDEMHDEPKW